MRPRYAAFLSVSWSYLICEPNKIQVLTQVGKRLFKQEDIRLGWRFQQEWVMFAELWLPFRDRKHIGLISRCSSWFGECSASTTKLKSASSAGRHRCRRSRFSARWGRRCSLDQQPQLMRHRPGGQAGLAGNPVPIRDWSGCSSASPSSRRL